jgi:hypothetical protein
MVSARITIVFPRVGSAQLFFHPGERSSLAGDTGLMKSCVRLKFPPYTNCETSHLKRFHE